MSRSPLLRRLVSPLLALTLLAPSVALARDWAKPPPSEASAVVATPAPTAAPARAAVYAALAARRKANLARFKAYRTAGAYPHNPRSSEDIDRGPIARNIWLDAEGHYCAAATMILGSGATDLVERTARDDNFVHLADVTSGGLLAWMLTSGLTQEEVALIQEPFMEIERPDQREAEDQRLAARYAEVEATIKAQRKASLQLATDRLMANPTLAASIVAAAS
jgi:hypothetical protein